MLSKIGCVDFIQAQLYGCVFSTPLQTSPILFCAHIVEKMRSTSSGFSDAKLMGGKRRTRKAHRKGKKATRKHRKSHRKGTRKAHRKGSRKH
jgi:hypothetical protein